jgi:hypothetical protein
LLNREKLHSEPLRINLDPEIPPLARADDTNAMTEPRREVPEITGDGAIRGSIYRNFKKLSIGGIGQLDPCFYRVKPLAGLQEKIQEVLDQIRRETKLRAKQRVLIFTKDAMIDEQFRFTA